MAALPLADIRSVLADFLRRGDVVWTITKRDVEAAAVALDAYFDAHAAEINAAIPQPARGALPTRLKLQIAAALLLRRAG